MKIRTGLLISMLAFAHGGCGGEEAAETPAEPTAESETAESEAPAPAEAPPAEAPAEAVPAAEAAPAAGLGQGADNAAQGMREGMAALGQMLQAAQNAEGGTPCETAYNASIAMLESLRQNLPEGDRPSADEIPPRETFVERCSELPEATQRCLVMTYAMEHQEECGAAMRTPEVAAFRASMAPGGGN